RPIALSCSIHRVLPTKAARLVLRLLLASGVAKKPVRSAPMVPPTPCTPKEPSASPYLKIDFSLMQAAKGPTPARTPMITAPVGETNPAPGVMTTRPAAAPEQ